MPIREPANFVQKTKQFLEEKKFIKETTKRKQTVTRKKNANDNVVKKHARVTSTAIASPDRNNQNSMINDKCDHANDETIANRYIMEEETEEEERIVLRALYVIINVDIVIENILNINDMIDDETIQLFLQIVEENGSQYEMHPIIYYRFWRHLSQKFIGYHGKDHLQIISGHEKYKHWICIHFDGTYLRIYDSIIS